MSAGDEVACFEGFLDGGLVGLADGVVGEPRGEEALHPGLVMANSDSHISPNAFIQMYGKTAILARTRRDTLRRNLLRQRFAPFRVSKYPLIWEH